MKISVITCTKNSEKYLADCLDSIQHQTYQDIEHIIIDGYSTDNTAAIIKKYIDSNPRKDIKFFQIPPQGISNALNFGIKKSSGEIIHFLHSDDFYYSKESVEKAIGYFSKNIGLEWLLGNHLLALGNFIIILPNTFLTRCFGKPFLRIFPWMSHQNTFIKKGVYEKYGAFDEKFKICLDYDHWLRLINRVPVNYANDNFSVFRVHRHSTTFNPQNYLKWIKEYRQALKKNTI